MDKSRETLMMAKEDEVKKAKVAWGITGGATKSPSSSK